jgi:hypothetical protein
MLRMSMIVGVCAGVGCGGPASADQPDAGPIGTSSCEALPVRHWQGSQPCNPIGSIGQLVANELSTIWGTEPTLICAYLPSEGRAGPCGEALADNAFYCPADNAIGWDIEFLDAESARSGEFAPVAIEAHEWGHRNQELLGLFNAGRSTFQNEQHADCQAGVFAAVEAARGLLQMGDVMSAFNSLCAISGTSGWFDPTSHGSCDERVAAFQRGYLGGGERLSELCSPARLQTMASICAN